jgi:hypothetical protein
MTDLKDLNILEFAGYISNYLNELGINCVLSGGACVSI